MRVILLTEIALVGVARCSRLLWATAADSPVPTMPSSPFDSPFPMLLHCAFVDNKYRIRKARHLAT